MDTKASIPVQQNLPTQEQGSSTLVVSQTAEGKVEGISEERIYEETAKVAAIFWEWRHKIMTHYFAGMAALIALIGWLYQQAGGIRMWLCAPLLLGAIFSFISYSLDKRNKSILEECYRIGKDLDYHSHKGGGIFSFLNDLHSTSGSYTQILKVLYLASTVLLLALSIIILIVA